MSLSAPPSLVGCGSTDPPTVNGGHRSNENIGEDNNSVNENSNDDDDDDEEAIDDEINNSVSQYHCIVPNFHGV